MFDKFGAVLTCAFHLVDSLPFCKVLQIRIIDFFPNQRTVHPQVYNHLCLRPDSPAKYSRISRIVSRGYRYIINA